MKTYILLSISIILLILCSSISFSNNNVSKGDIEAIIQGCRFGEEMIESGKGSITYEWTRIDTTNYTSNVINIKEENIIAFSGNYYYREIIQSVKQIIRNWDYNKKRIFKSSYNGENTYGIISAPDKRGLYYMNGFINSNNTINLYNDPRLKGAISLGNQKISDIIENSYNNGTLYINKNEIKNGIQYIFIKTVDANNDSIKIWISPNKMYRAEYIEKKIKDAEKKKERSDDVLYIYSIIYRTYDNNIYFPKNIDIKTYRYDNTTRSYKLETHAKINVHDNFVLNKQLSKDIFDINFPKGIEILDNRTNTTYIWE